MVRQEDAVLVLFRMREVVLRSSLSGNTLMTVSYTHLHGYDEGSMDVVEYHYNQHLGLLLIYELPDTEMCIRDRSSRCRLHLWGQS